MPSHAADDPSDDDPNPAATAIGTVDLTPRQAQWVEPLEHFLPGFVGGTDWLWLHPQKLPPAERGLLAHDHDMTPTLAEHYNSDIDLEVRRCELHGDVMRRLVVLHRRSDGRPVEVGAITIFLSGFDEPVRRAIEDGGEPLGGILSRFGVPHSSHPRAFFSCDAAAVAERLGDLHAAPPPAATPAHGRCNELRHAGGQVFAEIVEILPAAAA